MFIKPSRAAAATAVCGVFLAGGQAHAINIVLDYTYDTNNFFGSGNPDGAAAGAQARATLETAADFFTDLLEDSFSGISTPPQYNSQSFNGQVTWEYRQTFTSPGNGSTVTLYDPVVAEDEYRIYVGGRSLSGTTLGRGGPGGFGWSSSPSGGFTSAEITELNAITDAFATEVEERNTTDGGFNAWGGALTFDNDSSANWHYDSTTLPSSGEDDFFSVALHEIGHVVGLGTSDQWTNLISSGYFTGSEAVASFGGVVPADTGHFDNNVMSVVFGTTTAQEAAMDPTITEGTRKLFTDLDVAALRDIGWETAPAVTPGLAGDYNGDGFVSQADLDLVLLNWGDGSIPPAWTNPDAWDGVLISQNELDGVLLNWGNGTPPSSISAVAQSDLDLLLLNWGDTVLPTGSEDGSLTGLIDQDELDGVILMWGNGPPPPDSIIPEPTTAMAFAGLGGAMGWRRRR